MRVLAAPDKFRGTATAPEVAAAMARAVVDAGGTADEAPLADGGEGTLEALGGANRTTTVSGPLGDPVEAVWRLDRRAAVIEMARASGLDVVGGPEGNDAVAASTYGTGELIAAAVERGAREIVVAVGGSATTDGGLGALRALEPSQRLRGIEIRVACDVRLPFVDAAEVYGPQKGASPAQVELLRRRLERLAQIYEEEYGVDVTGLAGAGAAGGLAGGLAAIGAHLEPGFDLVADAIDLDERMEGCDLVVTGEGFLDEQSFDGKVVGGVAALAAALCVPVLVVAGDVMDPLPQAVEAVSLTERFGGERSRLDALACIEAVVADHLASS
ncbi:MAG TPA: glycerate kinase [Acidimicrobiales bacterium]